MGSSHHRNRQFEYFTYVLTLRATRWVYIWAGTRWILLHCFSFWEEKACFHDLRSSVFSQAPFSFSETRTLLSKKLNTPSALWSSRAAVWFFFIVWSNCTQSVAVGEYCVLGFSFNKKASFHRFNMNYSQNINVILSWTAEHNSLWQKPCSRCSQNNLWLKSSGSPR